MPRKPGRGMTRRRFAYIAGAGALAAGAPAFLFPDTARAAAKTLKIVPVEPLRPGYDKWFDGTFTKQWGQKNDTKVIVDHIAIGEINARAAAEVAAQKGHDLFMFLSPPAAYEKQVDRPQRDLPGSREEARQEDRSGATSPPTTRRRRSTSPSPTPTCRIRATTARTCGRRSASRTARTRGTTCASAARRSRTSSAIPCGIGLSQELDTNMAMRALLWSFGGAEQDDARQRDDQLEARRSRPSSTCGRSTRRRRRPRSSPGIRPPTTAPSWRASCRTSHNAISVTRSAEKDNPDMSTARSGCRRRSRAPCGASPPSTSWTAT